MSRKGWLHAWEHIQREFPDLRAGVWNCRKISGSNSWSQHSWGAAGDLTHKDYGYSTSPEHQAYLDTVAEWFDEHRAELSIWAYLWRTSGHYDHIHVDFEPRGADTPPCADGALRSRYRDGTNVPGDPGPTNGIWVPDDSQEGDEMRTLEQWVAVLRADDIQRAADAGVINQSEVTYWQGLLLEPEGNATSISDEWQSYRNAVEVRRV